ncbi:hypothetical protein [Paraburkholderia sp.]|uniref:hypothetical protein n=1 Tax=Paraburkholderia sp. TaxID=1926495 RepID=UPI0025EB24C5|nr:hypothetical protein [Paraburkholderia sp.]
MIAQFRTFLRDAMPFQVSRRAVPPKLIRLQADYAALGLICCATTKTGLRICLPCNVAGVPMSAIDRTSRLLFACDIWPPGSVPASRDSGILLRLPRKRSGHAVALFPVNSPIAS